MIQSFHYSNKLLYKLQTLKQLKFKRLKFKDWNIKHKINWNRIIINCSKSRNIKFLSIVLLRILRMLVQIQHRSSWWILWNRMLWLRCWSIWLWISKNWRWWWWCCLLLINLCIWLWNKWLRRDQLILCCCLRLLGCGSPTPSRRRRLDSWPSHLSKELLCAHNRLQAWSL